MVDRLLELINWHYILSSIFNGELLYFIKLAAVAISIFLIFLLFRKVFTRYLFQWITKLAGKTETYLDEKILDAFERPLAALFIVLGVFFAFKYLPLNDFQNIKLLQLFRTSLVIIVAWGLYNLTGSHSSFSNEIRAKLKIDYILVQFFSKIIRFLVVVIALLIIAEEWNYDVDGFVAGLGLGGLAFALAAKDALANIFGGIVIILDKPFSINDWIKTPSVEGTVEEISFRSTKVRAFDQSIITMPNSKLADEPITNFTRMGKRRITFHLGVTYDTSRAKLETVVTEIRNMLSNHPDIHPETIFVFFEQFNDSSLDIFLYFFTRTTVWQEFLAVKQDVNFKIMEILERQGVSVAFPSRSIYFENPQVVKSYIMDKELEEPQM